jgi:MoaA/NifB/PqqE/SkfB family radical SAM enzyme
LRGAGSWDRAIEASYVARAAGLEVSLKMVVTRTNAALSEIEAVLAAAGAVGGKAGFSPLEETPALGRRDLAPLWPAAEAWREVVDDLIRKKLAGDERVETSIAGLQYLRNWPVHAEIRCSAGVIYARIEPDGRLFGCGNLVRSGVHASLVDTPFADAFRAIGPGGCDSCWCDTRVEMNLVLGGSPSAIRAAVSR